MSSVIQKTQPASEQKIAAMFDRIAGRYDFLNTLLSFRQDHRWRKHLVKAIPFRNGGSYLDVATGTGDVLLAARAAHTEYRTYLGVDISSEMLKLAELKTRKSAPSPSNVSFQVMSAEKLNIPDRSVDCLSISFGLRNVIDKGAALKEFARVLKNNGSLMILEFFPPTKQFMALVFQLYFHHILPFIGGLFSDKEAYRYLPSSVEGFYSVYELIDLLEKCGYTVKARKRFLFGSCNLIQAQLK
jgi:demethylmenaquinone methyltransferase/2-methoxy-6-polyprenyl-1,4-benzoquinol methylase